jgi:hypothetical protein
MPVADGHVTYHDIQKLMVKHRMNRNLKDENFVHLFENYDG